MEIASRTLVIIILLIIIALLALIIAMNTKSMFATQFKNTSNIVGGLGY